jgi:F-box protein 28
MTYQKYIQNGTACFIPGKVIDECYKILRSISTSTGDTTRNLRAHEILQELRDISSMAIEHFDEKIVPDIKKSRPDANVSISSIYDLLTSTPGRSAPNYGEGLSFNLSRNSSSSSICHKQEPKRTKSSLSSIVKLYKKQSKVIKGQSKQISKMMRNMSKMKRQLIESEIKNREITESIKQLKAANKPSPAEETSGQIPKKRTATMVLKRRLDE